MYEPQMFFSTCCLTMESYEILVIYIVPIWDITGLKNILLNPTLYSCSDVIDIKFLAEFYSKDLILEIVSLNCVNLLGYFLFHFSIGVTVYYQFIYFIMLSGNIYIEF